MSAPIAPEVTTEGGQDPKQAAKQIAAAAIAAARDRGDLTPPPEPTPVPTPDPTVVPTDVTPTPTPTLPVEPGVVEPPPTEVVTPTEVAAVVAETGVPFEEVVEALAGFGIAVETDSVPDGLRDRYGQLLEGVKAVVEPVFSEAERARTQLQQMDTFKARLHEKPESILLALMVDKPEAFAKVMEIAERAKDDEEYRKTVVREVELEARESSLVARESRLSGQQLEEKGRRAEVATVAAARRHGIDSAVADRYVAGMISALGADAFDIASIDAHVASLRPKVAVPKPPPMVTPDAAAAAAAAPTTPVGDVTPPVPPGTTSGLTADVTQPHRGGFLRNLIKEAGGRVDRVVP